MWSVFSSKIESSYLCKDHCEVVITPISLRVISPLSKVISGHCKGVVKMFDINIEGDKS